MTDRVHRFRLEIDGHEMYGVAFATEAELERFCAARAGSASEKSTKSEKFVFRDRRTVNASLPAGGETAIDAPDQPKHRGRPSYSTMLAQAVEALSPELDPKTDLRARARLVLKHLAQQRAPAEIPSCNTVERYLRQKERQKWRQKSKCPKMHIGGS